MTNEEAQAVSTEKVRDPSRENRFRSHIAIGQIICPSINRCSIKSSLQEAADYEIERHEKTRLAKTVRTCRQLLKEVIPFISLYSISVLSPSVAPITPFNRRV